MFTWLRRPQPLTAQPLSLLRDQDHHDLLLCALTFTQSQLTILSPDLKPNVIDGEFRRRFTQRSVVA